MTHTDQQLRQIMARFAVVANSPWKFTACRPGLSGSAVWKVETGETSYCLKRIPEDFPVNRLPAIHRAANRRRALGMTYLAKFYPARDGNSYVSDGGKWELQSWMPGEPPDRPAKAGQKEAMFNAIGEFHRLAESRGPQQQTSPGLKRRLEILLRWQAASFDEHRSHCLRHGNPQWRSILLELLDSFGRYQARLHDLLLRLRNETYELDDCIGDPRPENFHFVQDQLSGMFDLGSMREDNIALDVARLAGELDLAAESEWRRAFASVGLHFRMTPSEERLAIVLDCANAVLTGLNWVQWLGVEGYRFEDCDQVSCRLAHLQQRTRAIEPHLAWKIEAG